MIQHSQRAQRCFVVHDMQVYKGSKIRNERLVCDNKGKCWMQCKRYVATKGIHIYHIQVILHHHSDCDLHLD